MTDKSQLDEFAIAQIQCHAEGLARIMNELDEDSQPYSTLAQALYLIDESIDEDGQATRQTDSEDWL